MSAWDAALIVLERVNGTLVDPVVVREGRSLLVRDLEVLVRVRPLAEDPVAAREVEVARALTDAEVPVAGTVGGHGQPWRVERSVVTAWRWCETVRPANTEDLGGLARQLRERTIGPAAFEVPRFDPLAAIRAAVAHVAIGDAQGDFVRRRAQEVSGAWARVADSDPVGTGIVHGDLHVGNALVTAEGPLLTDLEHAGAGPCAYDTAPVVVAVERYGAPSETLDAFLAAQGTDPREWPGFATCLAVYELFATAWAVGLQDRSEAMAAEAVKRVRCLQDEASEPWELL